MGFFDKLKSFDSETDAVSFGPSPSDLAPNGEKVDIAASSSEERWLPESEGQLAVDVWQTETELVISSTIAGVKPENLDIAIENDMVLIRGNREKPESISPDNYFCQECYFGPFSRSVILPVEVNPEKVDAAIKDGILTIRIQKLQKEKSKKIEVKMA